MNIKDIAKLSGVSKSTVSRYFNGGSVSEATKNKIEKIVTELDYKPNAIASRLKSKKSGLIGLIIDELSTRSVGIIVDSLQNELNKYNYQLFIVSNKEDDNQSNKVRSLQRLADQNVDAIIFGSSTVSSEQIKFLQKVKLPVIILGQQSSIFPFKKIEDYKGGHIMGEYISKFKPKKTLFLSMPLYDLAAGSERLAGFTDGIDTKFKVIECGYTPASVYEHKKEILDYNPDYVVCASDYLILGLLRILKEQGLLLAKDVKVAGFGNHDYSSHYALDLTSIDFDYPSLGINLARTVINLLNPNKKDIEEVEYNTNLIERNSTK